MSDSQDVDPMIGFHFWYWGLQAQAGLQTFERDRDLAALDRAAQSFSALIQDPTFARGRPVDRASALNDCGLVFYYRFEQCGDAADLDAAVEHFTAAEAAAPASSAAREDDGQPRCGACRPLRTLR